MYLLHHNPSTYTNATELIAPPPPSNGTLPARMLHRIAKTAIKYANRNVADKRWVHTVRMTRKRLAKVVREKHDDELEGDDLDERREARAAHRSRLKYA